MFVNVITVASDPLWYGKSDGLLEMRKKKFIFSVHVFPIAVHT